MTTHTKSSALIFRSILHSKRNRLEKGFTLIELLVTVGLVGVLSATALPAFINAQEKGKAGALIGTLAGFAKECATNAVSGDSTALSVPTTVTLGDTDCSDGATLKNATGFDGTKIGGLTCGVDSNGDAVTHANTTHLVCTFTVSSDGEITGAWGAT